MLVILLSTAKGQSTARSFSFDYFGEQVNLQINSDLLVKFDGTLTNSAIVSFTSFLEKSDYKPLIETLLAFKDKQQLNDWLYYQLIRKTAQQISPKAENYHRYTLYKWFLLTRSGYEATIKISNDKMLFYIKTDETIYNIPYYTKNDQQYVCLNYHDYGSNIDFDKEKFTELELPVAGGKAFSYKITRLPDFRPASYQEKEIQFNYNQSDYNFKIKLNPDVKTIFINYPVVDYASYFNIPLSNETYSSLIPSLKENVKGMTVKNGVDYLMHFTRYAFLFKTDNENFGAEKRLTPEQTLLYDESDCDDRAALFFCLVKEIYDLPMIVLTYPEHVTVAIKFDKPVGKPIIYNGMKYSVCEPTPQKTDLGLGQLLPALRSQPYEVAYAYFPTSRN
ncbi:MAG: hypothetical protein HOP10_11780 [Chitinophagaceae bacterium]|nr:hypothetical protein [Chitinophagaceae bacterium]